ncbi:uncharacterized protein CELE_F56C3.3 [Caenorhabditis elegans]|uniref:Transmembrane protein n=1 Tax=Caenorhabditis elegans TaxID=6239 RepID=O61753_CAEEL|nr:Transmembrane protein [Caenorhabditis elegans]CCD69808.2 Transmembrane protein [Caenorhabditis elegans]
MKESAKISDDKPKASKEAKEKTDADDDDKIFGNIVECSLNHREVLRTDSFTNAWKEKPKEIHWVKIGKVIAMIFFVIFIVSLGLFIIREHEIEQLVSTAEKNREGVPKISSPIKPDHGFVTSSTTAAPPDITDMFSGL